MIYVHIPFCRSRCVYCAFYSNAVSGDDCFTDYVERLCQEAESRRKEIEKTLSTNTLYIGGGTPSVLSLSLLSRIADALPYGPFDEFTVEVNPEDIIEKGLGYAVGLKGLGVNRVSIGVQSFDDGILRWMGRRHDAAGTVEAFRILREAGFDNISIDLIFGVPGLTCEMWEATIENALALRPEHISAYQLSVEEGSALDRRASRGETVMLPEEECRSQYDILCRMMSMAGYNHYEISNFALPGREAKHNSAYWDRSPYVGLGAGAHSFDGNQTRGWNTSSYNNYSHVLERLVEGDVRVEKIMLGLRTSEGLSEDWLRSNTEKPALDSLLLEKALVRAGNMKLRIPESHFFVSDEIIRSLI